MNKQLLEPLSYEELIKYHYNGTLSLTLEQVGMSTEEVVNLLISKFEEERLTGE